MEFGVSIYTVTTFIFLLGGNCGYMFLRLYNNYKNHPYSKFRPQKKKQ